MKEAIVEDGKLYIDGKLVGCANPKNKNHRPNQMGFEDENEQMRWRDGSFLTRDQVKTEKNNIDDGVI